jgi:hypothetical protein
MKFNGISLWLLIIIFLVAMFIKKKGNSDKP